MGGKQSRSKSSPFHGRTRPPGPSRGKVIDMLRQAVGFHAGGQLAMADHLYRQVLDLDPQHADALHWLGVLEGQSGNLAAAVDLLERAVASNPQDPVAFNDLGTAQRGLNRREQALESYARALDVKPDYAKVYSDRGAVLHELMRLDEARASLEQALALAPGDVEALLRQCRVLAESGELAAALEQSVRGLALEDSARTQGMFAEALKTVRFQGPAAGLQELIVRAIDEPWGRPNELGPAVASFLRQVPALKDFIARAALPPDLSAGPSLQALLTDAEGVRGDPVLLAVLRNVLVSDAELESLLTLARRAALIAFGSGGVPSPALLEFLCALAQQCFINEYVFAITDAETSRVAELRQRVGAMTGSGAVPDAMSVILAACYGPLTSIADAEALLQHPWPHAVSRVLEQQLEEPAEERRCAALIPALTPVSAGVSQQVRQQYEECPYP
ncbi:MAG: tetratricopeptide repeat protein, partial [Betaproteobacteria bacterium]|nr:tetratricopeptide repeat protein [Betaproteobacteria bacterium]